MVVCTVNVKPDLIRRSGNMCDTQLIAGHVFAITERSRGIGLPAGCMPITRQVLESNLEAPSDFPVAVY